MGIEVGGILGFLILLADIFAIMKVMSSSAGTGSKVIWTLIILLLPILGLILWYFAGPKG